MQLNKPLAVKSALAIATSILIGTGSAVKATDVESTILIYSEKDRVSAAEGAVSIKHEIKEDQQIKIKVTYDALTGASPNGAAPSDNIQTYTRPSGIGDFNVPAGEIPLDDTFNDIRIAANATYSRKLGRLNNIFIGGSFSGEHDYTSIGINGGISRDFNNKNRTISLSVSFSSDNINPEGGIPIPYAKLALAGEATQRTGSEETKEIYDILLGVTQTLDIKTLFRANYSRSHSSGYLNDPYKIISVVQDELSTSPGEPVDFIYESRPDSRNKQSIYSQLRRYYKGNTIDLSYRFFWDDWGINSHTVNLFYLIDFKNGKSIEPHVRWYHQTASDYYVPTLVENNPLPLYATADYRLSKFSALTFGLQYMFPIADAKTIKLSFEYYTQFGDSSPQGTLGSQLNYDLFPTLNSVMFRVGYNFSF